MRLIISRSQCCLLLWFLVHFQDRSNHRVLVSLWRERQRQEKRRGQPTVWKAAVNEWVKLTHKQDGHSTSHSAFTVTSFWVSNRSWKENKALLISQACAFLTKNNAHHHYLIKNSHSETLCHVLPQPTVIPQDWMKHRGCCWPREVFGDLGAEDQK